ncbi:CDP-alcohol phosphatidyltransferase [Streptomyces sp. NPDC006739]|uniref:CDP-alcohol phosphatidyltransferase n=1 Tax=Streptomyces sp. NPDC006739 TaxID=3364763 RepID=UPI0036B86B8B
MSAVDDRTEPVEETATEDISVADAPEAASEDAPPKAASAEDTPPEAASAEDTTSEAPSAEDTPPEAASAGEEPPSEPAATTTSESVEDTPAPVPATAPGTAAATPDPTADSPVSPDSPRRPSLPYWPGWSRRRRREWKAAYPTAANVLSIALNLLAAGLVVAALLLPDTIVGLRLRQFVRIPAEAIIGAAVLTALPRRPRIVLAAVSGAALGAMSLLNFLDMGFNQYLGRPFNPILDWSLLGDAQSYLNDSLGHAVTLAATVGVVVLVLALFLLPALATVRLGNLLARHTGTATRGTLIAGVAWITCSSLGIQLAGIPLASDRTASALKVQAHQVAATLHDEAEFAKVAKVDAFGNTPPAQLLPDLRGKDMIFTFIESYGRSAVEDPIMAPGVDSTLDARTQALAKAGFHAKSGWLTSATYGGSSWLGHSTTMSGLWISNQQRYRTVMASDHLSLTDAFKKTGAFDTVGVMPGVQKAWPEQKYYGLDKVYNAFELGYKGPKFSWSTMPDQYALQQYQDRVHSKLPADGKARMSLLILTSSHQPWAPIPKMVGWDQLGDGSIFKGIQAAGNNPADVIADTTKSRQEYGKTIQYSVTALTEWLTRYGTKDTVLVFLGDHQPIARVSGNHASRDVPISIVAKDPKVLDKIASWNWTDGLRPAHNAPVWKMSAFRDRFLAAYGSTPHPKQG